MSTRLFMLLQELIKIFVVLAGLLLTIHIGMLILGYDPFWAEWLCGFSVFGFVMLFIASYLLKLCNLFRAFLIFDFVADQCIVFQREVGIFGDYIDIARMVMFATGASLVSIYIYREIKRRSYERDDKCCIWGDDNRCRP